VTMVAVCTDNPAPAEASAFSSCTSVAWTDSGNVAPGIFDGATIETMSPVAGSILLLWAMAYGIRKCIDAVQIGTT
jgi:hypothetical protein